MKRLYKNSHEKMICGVCQGISEYLGIDVTVVRLIFVLLGFASGVGLILYIVAAIIMPDKFE